MSEVLTQITSLLEAYEIYHKGVETNTDEPFLHYQPPFAMPHELTALALYSVDIESPKQR